MDEHTRIKPLSQGNYRAWSFRMKSFLRSQRLLNVVIKHQRPMCPGPELDKWNRNNSDALALIVLRVDDNQLPLLRHIESAYEAWKALKHAHVNRSTACRVRLLRQLSSRRCATLSSLQRHLESFQDNIWQLEVIGVEIPETLLVAMLLNSLPKSFFLFTSRVELRDELPSLSKLLVEIREERDRQEEKTRRSQRALERCTDCGRLGHATRQCRSTRRINCEPL